MAVLSPTDAIDIFEAKQLSRAGTYGGRMRDGLAASLSAKYKITERAVRDIWNLRTWTWKTMPYWTKSDHELYLRKH